MKKKSLFSGFSAKIALLVMGLSGALLTGCYKDDGLGDNPIDINPRPVAPATYSIYGTVTDIETGENIPNAQVNCEGKTYQVNDGYNIAISEVSGSKDVQLTFTAPDYNTITRTINIKEVEPGQSANYSVSVSLKKNVEKDVLDIYTVSFKVVDMEGNPVDVKVIEPVLTNGTIEKEAGSVFTVRTAETAAYKAQVTTVTLPITYSKESVAQPAKTYEANIYVEKQDEPITPADTYTNISGVVVDKNGKLLNAEIKLVGGTEQTEQGSAFCFSIKNTKDQVSYHVEATVDGVTVKSPNFSVPACGNQNITLVFTEKGDENAPKDVVYDITFKAYDAETLQPLPAGVVPTYIFGGEQLTGNTATGVKAGKYEVRAIATNYNVAITEIELAAVKNETGKEAKTVAVYFTEKAKDPTLKTTVYIYGEVLDKRGYIVPAQSIKLYDGTELAAEPIYNKGTYKFAIEVAPEVTNKTWKIVAEVKDENKVVKQAAACTYNGTATALNTNIQYLQFNIDENGKVEKPQAGDGETGSVTPDQDVTTGEVTGTVEVAMTGTDAAGEEDKTTMTLSEGTIITDKDGNPVVASIAVVRDTEEERNPSDTPDKPNVGESVVQPIVIRAYEGFPDGIQFSKPLEFTFADIYGGQLGSSMKLEYYNASQDAWQEETQNASVTLSGTTYTMKVPHFSKFRAVVKNTIEYTSEAETEGTVVVKEKIGTNSSLENQTVNVTYQGNIEGTIFQEPLADAMQRAGIDNSKAQAIIAAIIKNYFALQGIDIADQLTAGERTIPVTVPALTMVKNWKITPKYADAKFSFTIADKTFEFTVRALSNIIVEMGETQSVEHGHSHGDNWNAGGGIIVGE